LSIPLALAKDWESRVAQPSGTPAHTSGTLSIVDAPFKLVRLTESNTKTQGGIE